MVRLKRKFRGGVKADRMVAKGKSRSRRAAGAVADDMFNLIHRNKVKSKNRAANRVARKQRKINARHKR